ncbi:MAG: MarC family protein, partial [Desulfurococcales archaeon]|nr:MarC family protein [Desulfurococcales archaeon]
MNGGWYSSNSLLVSILMLFIVLDPIGNSPYFYILTRNYSSEARRKIISMSVSVAAFIMLFFAVLGDIIFELLDVTVDDFRIAAGIILLIYFIAILLEIDLGPKQVSEENIAVVPLAMP